MYFTQEDYIKIENWLHRNSVKDTEFQEALPLTGEEIVTIVQDGHNRKVNIQEFINQLYKHGVGDFLNVTNTYEANNITLNEAIRLIPAEARKEGLVITFLNTDGNWEIYQFIGKLNQWNNYTLWDNPFDWEKFVVDSILPDEEDLTKSAPDANGNSHLSLKDRKYEPDEYSGLGRKILRRRVVEIEDPIYGTQEKNLLLQADFDEENTIYVVRYDFTLNGQDITLPDNSYIEYEGGSISDGNIIDVAGGLNRIILKKNIVNGKNILTQEMVSKSNTIYEIRYDFDLNGEEITIPENCVLKFEGGSFKNGTIDCQDTMIEGCINCIKGISITGTITNDLKFSWIGIFGANADNSTLFASLGNYPKNFEVDSDITFSAGDLQLPRNCIIRGNKHSFRFSCETTNEALLLLAHSNELRDLSIVSKSTNYAGVYLLASTEPKEHNFYSRFILSNITISGTWTPEPSTYLGTGLKIQASNMSSDGNNYVTGSQINNLRCFWLHTGIEINCFNVEKDSNDFAWLNQIYMSDVYVSSNTFGIKTEYTDTATTNKSDSVGPLYMQNFEYQALVKDAVMFNHNGKWTLNINTGFCYDSTYKGIINSGIVNVWNVEGCYQPDGQYTDDTGTYKQIDSVKIYSGNYHRNPQRLSTSSTYRQGNYNPVSGMQYWENGCLGKQSFGFRHASNYLYRKTFQNSSRKFAEEIGTAGPKFMQIYSQNKDGYGYYMAAFAKRYGINNKHIKLINFARDWNNGDIAILDSTSNSETYLIPLSLSALSKANKTYDYKIRIVFKIDGEDANYAAYRTKYANKIVRVAAISMSSHNNVKFNTKEEDGELYIYVSAYKTSESTYIHFYATLRYSNIIRQDEYEELTDGEIDIKISNEWFANNFEPQLLRSYYAKGISANRPDFTSDAFQDFDSIGFQFFDTTINKSIWWTGTAWVDATGAEV